MHDSRSRSHQPLSPEAELATAQFRKRLGRERRARVEAEKLLEEKSGELFDAYQQLSVESARARVLLSAVEASSDGIALTNGAGCFTYMNAAHASMFGYTPGELIGQPWSLLYSPATTVFFETVVMPILPESGNWRGEVEGVGKSGAPVRQEVVLTDRGEDGLICVTRDIGERMAREKEARELEARLLKAEREAALFIVGNAVAHDFNNLIAAISGYALLLQHDLDEGSASFDWAGRILQAAEQASDVVRSLEVERNNDVRAIDELDLVKLLRTGLAISEAIRPKGIRLEVDLPEIVLVRSNEVLLSRALVNIAKNAFEAMHPAGTFTVRLTAQASSPFAPGARKFRLGDLRRPAAYVLELTDTGTGIPPEKLESVFDPFMTTKGPMRGSGLGLLSLKALVDTGSADVEVETLLGHGTSFRILFPAPEMPQREKTVSFRRKPERTRGQSAVLVVDDNAVVGQMLAETLTRQGFIADWEPDPSTALKRIESADFDHDVLLTDLTMPGLRGDELARRAKAAQPNLPIILYSGQASYMPTDPIYSDILTKPIHPDRLQDAISRALENQEGRSILGL
jgi:PAS domain S-box-containing protein